MMNWKLILAIIKVRYSRGSAWLSFITSFGVITANIYLYREFMPQWLPLSWACVIALLAYFILCYFIGHFDEKNGIWKMENLYGANLSPYNEEVLRRVKCIEEEVKR